MVKVLSILAAFAALLPAVQAGGCNDYSCDYAPTCSKQEKCMRWEVKKLDASVCEVGGRCPVEVCMIIDTSMPSCECAPMFDRVCDNSNDQGCQQFDQNNNRLFWTDGRNTGSITMCQQGYPGQWMTWVLQDAPGNQYTSREYGWMDGFEWKDGCKSWIYCENQAYKCRGPSTNNSQARTWWFKIPDTEDTDCDICAAPEPCTSGPTSAPTDAPTDAPPPPPPPPGSNGDPHCK